MTQDPDLRPSPSSTKRSTRAGRNRPVLVTPAEIESQENGSTSEPATDELTEPVKEFATESLSAQETPAAPRRRLPGFFSTVGKTTETAASKTAEVAEARIARAKRGKTAPSTSSASNKATPELEKPSTQEEKKEPTGRTVASAPARPQRPPSPFKTKYLLGMGLYLVGADLFGVVESNFFASNHIDSTLTTFSLFNLPFVIKTSTIVYLVTLVAVLVILARFDLIPRSFGTRPQTVSTSNKSGANKSGSANRLTNQRTNMSNTPRVSPPTMKRGVKGRDDDLYQEYRSNQRRKK